MNGTTHFDRCRACPECGHQFTAATDAYGVDTPKPGDVSFCIQCGTLLVFDGSLSPVRPTPAELADLERCEEWPRIIRAQQVLRSLIEAQL